MANEYCRLLSNGFRFNNSELKYNPCCWVPESPPIHNINDLNQYRIAITNEVLANKTRYCQDCIKREDSGFGLSLRQKSFRQVPDDAVDGDIVDLSIQIDKTCNAACTICGPVHSSLWRKEMNPLTPLENTIDQYTKLAEMVDLSKLRTLRFYGGEPLVNDNHLTILNAVPYPENVIIMYSTNGSITPNNETITAWGKFKGVDIAFSIDDINERFHYIRWPLQWNKVKNNIETFAKIPAVTQIAFNCTINPMNILYFDQLESWVNDLKTNYSTVTNLHISACYGTWGTDTTPGKLRNKVIEKYGKNHRVVKLLSSIGLRPDKWTLLVQDMEGLDQRRKLSWKDTFPEVASICL